MEFAEVVRQRRMVRDFLPDPLDAGVVDGLIEVARRAPSAGNSQGWAFLVLEGGDVARYWDTTLPAPRRPSFPWPGLLRAPVLLLPCAHADAYVARYAEQDKARTGLGAGRDAWAVPYWLIDTAMAAMTILLGAVDVGLGACLFGIFDHEPAVRAAFGIPDDHQPIGTIALGRPAPEQRSSRSARRPRPPLESVVHRGRWGW
jgi:nitroreductase